VIRILWGKMAERHDDDESKIARAIIIGSSKIQVALLAIADAIRPVATTLRLTYQLQGGNSMGAPVTATVGQAYNPSVVESNATTPSIPPIGPLVFASDNTAVVTVDAGGIATTVAAGTANVSVIDQGNSLTDTVPFTVSAVTPPVATALALNYTLA
jgi:hypothetical protein